MHSNRGGSGEGKRLMLLIGLAILLIPAMPVRGNEVPVGGSPETIAQLQTEKTSIGRHRQLGTVNFIGVGHGVPLVVPGLGPGAVETFNAMVWAERYGALFGLNHPREELLTKGTGINGGGGGRVRYQQLWSGVPVFGGELIVNMDRGGAMLSMNGEIGALPKASRRFPRLRVRRPWPRPWRRWPSGTG